MKGRKSKCSTGGERKWIERRRGQMREGRDSMCPGSPRHLPSLVVHFDDTDPTTTGQFRRRAVEPQNAGHVHPLIQRHTSGEVDKLVHSVHIVRLPDHLLMSLLGVGPRSANGEGEIAAVEGEREGIRRWRSDNAENLRRICDLDPENLTFRVVLRLDQELHRIDLCNIRSIYASRKHHLEAGEGTDVFQNNPRLGTN